MWTYGIVLVAAVLVHAQQGRYYSDYDSDGYHPNLNIELPAIDVDWWQHGQDELNRYLAVQPITTPAKNVILFIGDGMGITTETASRWYMQQRRGLNIHETKLAWEKMPFTSTIKTYTSNFQTSGSESTATALMTGHKTRTYVIGCNASTLVANCSTMQGNELRTILEYSADEGKWSGVVTNTRVTHATPASAYGHNPTRNWEGDIEPDERPCKDFAAQIVEDHATNLRVILGGGRSFFYGPDWEDPEYPLNWGERNDSRNLPQEWLDQKRDLGYQPPDYHYVYGLDDFNAVDPDRTEFLMGLFERSHMRYETDRPNDLLGEPSLSEMTEKAIRILSKNPNGYFLMVEGGRIDTASHGNSVFRVVNETVAMSDAVDVALSLTDESDTLIVVTADHSHTLTMAGYPGIDDDILGLEKGGPASDLKPFMTLGYMNGPGFYNHRTLDGTMDTEMPRIDLTNVTTDSVSFRHDSGIPLGGGTHGGEEVGAHARGPFAHLLTGTHEQSYVGHVMMYASCVGPNKSLCEGKK